MNAPRLDCFANDYKTARQLFLDVCQSCDCRLEAREYPRRGPAEEVLALDVAFSPHNSNKLLILSSGLHGVEGLLGSALQIDALRNGLLDRAATAGWSVLLLHAMNPFGFAHVRRWDQQNVDPNRNFLLHGQSTKGAHAIYHQLSSLLNPSGPPAWHDNMTFYANAFAAVLRHGFDQVRQAVAEGQFEVPQGLFFGGNEPCWTQRVLSEILNGATDGISDVVHFDIHSGLGKWGNCQLLSDHALSPWQREWLDQRYEQAQWEAPSGKAYHARGGLGRWCNERYAAHNYLYLCAEFGTYKPLRVLRSLRAENQAWHHAPTRPTKTIDDIREMFCPRQHRWRTTVLETGRYIVEKVIKV